MFKENETLVIDDIGGRSFDALVLENAIKSASRFAPPVQVFNRATREHNRAMYAAMPDKAKRDKARAKRKRKSR